jgi:hypothetical protein
VRQIWHGRIPEIEELAHIGGSWGRHADGMSPWALGRLEYRPLGVEGK